MRYQLNYTGLDQKLKYKNQNFKESLNYVCKSDWSVGYSRSLSLSLSLFNFLSMSVFPFICLSLSLFLLSIPHPQSFAFTHKKLSLFFESKCQNDK